MLRMPILALGVALLMSFTASHHIEEVHNFNLPIEGNFAVQKMGTGNYQVSLFYENNQLKELSTLDANGLLNGEFKKWNEEGVLVKEWNFRKNKLHGSQKSWSASGDLEYEMVYYNGKQLNIE